MDKRQSCCTNQGSLHAQQYCRTNHNKGQCASCQSFPETEFLKFSEDCLIVHIVVRWRWNTRIISCPQTVFLLNCECITSSTISRTWLHYIIWATNKLTNFQGTYFRRVLPTKSPILYGFAFPTDKEFPTKFFPSEFCQDISCFRVVCVRDIFYK